MSKTTLQMASREQMEELQNQHPMKISDAASMLRRKIGNNERPYIAKVLKLNNAVVDDWESKVLKKIADEKGEVPAGRIASCFETFHEGIELRNHNKYKDMMFYPPEDKVKFWIDLFLKSDIETLYKIGPMICSSQFIMIKAAIRLYFADNKIEAIYSKSEDPLKWDVLANDNHELMRGRKLPFDLTEEKLHNIAEKINTIIIPIEPHDRRQ